VKDLAALNTNIIGIIEVIATFTAEQTDK